jgi:pyruvate/2-oxoglutarate dehydrogenase complex dihydrolipoamide acyltransferase (E2) component
MMNRDNPYVSEEDQDMEMTPVVMGPPGYGSPDPNTSAGVLVPIVDHPLSDDISEDYGADVLEAQTTEEGGEEEGDEEDGGEGNATAGAIELANEKGVDLTGIEGTGSGGRVTKADVENFLASQDSE